MAVHREVRQEHLRISVPLQPPDLVVRSASGERSQELEIIRGHGCLRLLLARGPPARGTDDEDGRKLRVPQPPAESAHVRVRRGCNALRAPLSVLPDRASQIVLVSNEVAEHHPGDRGMKMLDRSRELSRLRAELLEDLADRRLLPGRDLGRRPFLGADRRQVPGRDIACDPGEVSDQVLHRPLRARRDHDRELLVGDLLDELRDPLGRGPVHARVIGHSRDTIREIRSLA